MNTLHIYAQTIWHDEAYVAGTRGALMAFRDAIDLAVSTDSDGFSEVESFASDGEGYRTHVILVTEDQADQMSLPYTDEVARDRKKDKVTPWALISLHLTRQSMKND